MAGVKCKEHEHGEKLIMGACSYSLLMYSFRLSHKMWGFCRTQYQRADILNIIKNSRIKIVNITSENY